MIVKTGVLGEKCVFMKAVTVNIMVWKLHLKFWGWFFPDDLIDEKEYDYVWVHAKNMNVKKKSAML